MLRFVPAIFQRYPPLCLALLAVLLLVPGLGEPTGLTGQDEFYLGLRTPMEMMVGDHWLIPFLDGAPRLRKPPLLYWLGRGSFELFGISLVSARLVAVAFAALLVAATAGIARRLTGETRYAWLAGGILLGCLGLHSEGRRFMLDVPVAALSAAAFWSLLRWLEERHWRWLSVSTVLLAAGFLVKGPVVALVCGGGLFALVATQRLRVAELRRHRRALALHAALLLALILPWFIAVRLLYPEAAALTLNDELESRHFLDIGPQAIVGLVNLALPWSFVFVAAAWQHRRDAGVLRLALIWLLVTVLPFLLLRSFDRYLIGSLLPLSLGLALVLPRLEARWPFRLGLLLLLGFSGLLALFAWRFDLGGWYWLLPAGLYFAWAWWQPRPLAHTLAAPALLMLTLLWGIFPALGINAVPAHVLELGRTREIAFFDGPQPALLPILTQRPHKHFSSRPGYDAAALAASQALIFAESADVPRLEAAFAAAGLRLTPLGSYRALVSHGSGLRFARQGATLADWQEAWRHRQIEPLTTRIEWFEIVRR